MIRPHLCYFKEQFPISQLAASVTRPWTAFFGVYLSQKKCYYRLWKVLEIPTSCHLQLVSDKKKKKSNYLKGLGKLLRVLPGNYLFKTSVTLLWSLLMLSLCGGKRAIPSIFLYAQVALSSIPVLARGLLEIRSSPSLMPPLIFEGNLEMSANQAPLMDEPLMHCQGKPGNKRCSRELSPAASAQHVSHLHFLHLPNMLRQRRCNN